jgi:hypothetical protein
MEYLPEEGPSVEDIRKALAGLVTEGIIPYNVGENGGCLLDLALVQARREPLARDAPEAQRHAAHAEALTSVLTEAVEDEKIGGKPRRLLHDVLPLRPELLNKTVKERRTEAGKNLKPGKKAVEPGTIRTYYEPKALKKLSEVLWRLESEFRAAHRDGKPADPDEQDS